MTERPNVLFLMADQHRPDTAGFTGNDVVRTPTLDWLAETGVTFSNAYTPSPACVPARQCLASGRLPLTWDVDLSEEGLPPQSMTVARRFAQHAYDTVGAGKMAFKGEDKAEGWTTLLTGGGCEVEVLDTEADERCSRPFQEYKWPHIKEIKRAGIGRSDVGWKSRADEYSAQRAVDYLEQKYLDPYYDRENPDRPVMLKASFSQPHYPFFTSEEKFTYYLNRVEPFIDEDDGVFDDHPFLGKTRAVVGEDVSEREVRRATAAYYGMVETVDEYFERVLDALAHAGEDLDEWIIVYTSDHGEMLGEHGVWMKRSFFEASARVPLIVRWPDQFEPRTVDENVNLCDLFATLCDLAEIPVPEQYPLDSRSLVPLMQGDSSGWSDETISEYDGNLMIKHGDLKYLSLTEGTDVLFDLDADPGETTNVIDDSQYEASLDRFRERRDKLGYGPHGDPADGKTGYSAT